MSLIKQYSLNNSSISIIQHQDFNVKFINELKTVILTIDFNDRFLTNLNIVCKKDDKF